MALYYLGLNGTKGPTMQFFIDTVTNTIHAFNDGVVVKETNGTYLFAAPNGDVLNTPTTLQPYTPSENQSRSDRKD